MPPRSRTGLTHAAVPRALPPRRRPDPGRAGAGARLRPVLHRQPASAAAAHLRDLSAGERAGPGCRRPGALPRRGARPGDRDQAGRRRIPPARAAGPSAPPSSWCSCASRSIPPLGEVPSLDEAVRLGLRARIAAQGITGVSYMELDFVTPDRFPRARCRGQPRYPYIPSVPSTVAQVQDAAERLLLRLEEADRRSFSAMSPGARDMRGKVRDGDVARCSSRAPTCCARCARRPTRRSAGTRGRVARRGGRCPRHGGRAGHARNPGECAPPRPSSGWR